MKKKIENPDLFDQKVKVTYFDETWTARTESAVRTDAGFFIGKKKIDENSIIEIKEVGSRRREMKVSHSKYGKQEKGETREQGDAHRKVGGRSST